MAPDSEPINNQEAAKRAEVSRVKMIINHKGEGHLLTLPHDPDFPTVSDEEKEVVRSFKMQGVDTIDDLFNRTQASGYPPEKAKEVLDIVSTAVAEVMMESGHTQVLVAGSASTEKFLSIAWLGHDRKNENNPSFAFMVAEKFREKIGAGEKRDEVTSVMEYLDFVKNSDYAKNSGLEEAAVQADERLSRIRPNVLNKKEMEAYAELRRYVSSLHPKDTMVNNDGVSIAAEKLAEKMGKAFGRDDRRSEGEKDIVTPEKSLEKANELLDILERSTYASNDIAIGEVTRRLNDLSYRINLKHDVDGTSPDTLRFSDVALLIQSRLALHDSEFYMSNSGFVVTDKGGISEAIDRICKERRVLDQERLTFLLRECGKGKIGIPIADAWNWIEKANFNYVEVLEMVADEKGLTGNEREKYINPGRVTREYDDNTTIEGFMNGHWLDLDIRRKADVDAFIIKKVSEKTHMDGAKAYQLAQKLVTATGECSVFNFGLVAGDTFAECIHFAYFRADDARKGKNVGAMSNMDVQTLTPGWLRSLSKRSTIGVLNAEDIFVEEAKGKSTIDYYFGQTLVRKVQRVKEAYLDNEPDSKKLVDSGRAYLNSLVDCFSKTEPPLDIIEVPGLGWRQIKTESFYKNNDCMTGKIEKKYTIDGYNGIVQIEKDDTRDSGFIVKFPGDMDWKSTLRSRDGRSSLKSKYVLGLLELIATRKAEVWDEQTVSKLRRVLVETALAETAKPFINDDIWNWVNEQIVAKDEKGNEYKFYDAYKYGRRYARRSAMMRAFLEGGGKKGGKK